MPDLTNHILLLDEHEWNNFDDNRVLYEVVWVNIDFENVTCGYTEIECRLFFGVGDLFIYKYFVILMDKHIITWVLPPMGISIDPNLTLWHNMPSHILFNKSSGNGLA